MKLVRYGPYGGERPGLIDSEGNIRDLSHLMNDIAGQGLLADMLDMVRKLDADMLPIVEGTPRLGACVGAVRNFIGVGFNYANGAENTSPTSQPVLFSKAPSCIIGANDPIMLPRGSVTTDWEVELAVVIGRRGSYIREEQANDYIAGYCICNDLTERAEQQGGTGQFVKAKSAPTFGPLGPWLVTGDEILDPHNLNLWLDVNGKKMQKGSTKDMIVKIPALISYISKFMALEPGDVITTGTPTGTGATQDPPVYLKKGDKLKLGVEGLGLQEQKVLAWID